MAWIGRIARQLGIGDQSLRTWVAQAEIDAGKRAGLTHRGEGRAQAPAEGEPELKRSNEILRSASAFFAAELDRPSAR